MVNSHIFNLVALCVNQKAIILCHSLRTLQQIQAHFVSFVFYFYLKAFYKGNIHGLLPQVT